MISNWDSLEEFPVKDEDILARCSDAWVYLPGKEPFIHKAIKEESVVGDFRLIRADMFLHQAVKPIVLVLFLAPNDNRWLKGYMFEEYKILSRLFRKVLSQHKKLRYNDNFAVGLEVLKNERRRLIGNMKNATTDNR